MRKAAALVRLTLPGLVLLGAGGCNWGRFTELRENAPVERLEPPDDYDGSFGLALAVALGPEDAQLYVAPRSLSGGGLTYSLGLLESPSEDPRNRSACPLEDSDGSCSTVVQPAGLSRAWAPPGRDPLESCFVSGVGTLDDDEGLWTRCANGTRFILEVGAERFERLTDTGARPPRVRLATNRSVPQLLFASSEGSGDGWVYEPESRSPIDFTPPADADDSLGRAVAVAADPDGYTVAWGAPGQDRVYLYRVVEGAAEPWACLEGAAGFGRTLASGELDGDDVEDLAIADDERVSLIADLPNLPNLGFESCISPDDAAVSRLARVSCEAEGELSACAGSEYGASLAVFDSDGDGIGEVAVGAPDLTVRGVARAGAVFVYEADGSALRPAYASDGAQGDNFGSSLAAVPQDGREILAVGAPGTRRVYLHYCAGAASGELSARCP